MSEGSEIIGVSQPLAAVLNNIIKDGDHAAAEKILTGVVELSEEINKIPEGDYRVEALHEWIDDYIKDDDKMCASAGRELSCRAGCGACCAILVEVQDEEADYVYGVIKKKGISLDRERLLEQSSYSMSDYQKNYFSGKSKCALLGEDNLCTIYEERPMACRLHVSVDDPELCKPTLDGEARDHLKFARISSEMLYSAYMQKKVGVPHPYESLPKALLRRLDDETKRSDS